MADKPDDKKMRHHTLESQAFSVDRYIDEEKPDPLQKRQMEGWTFEWQPLEEGNDNNSSDKPSSLMTLDFEPTHVLAGSLVWTGEHVVVTLQSRCYWRTSSDDDDGSLFFECTAAAEMVAELPGDKKEAKIAQKVRERLQQDDYIAKLLKCTKEGKEESRPLDLCQASVVTTDQTERLEERVHCNEVAAEAVRRAVYSTAPNGPIDVFEVVCSALPLLPFSHTQLAQRAKLRLLEDAMYDACENEAEEELVEDLKLEQQRNGGATGKEQPTQQNKKKKR